MLILIHKPFGVLSQFTSDGSSHRTLADFALPPRCYPLGRLDADSEGMLLLTDESALNQALLHPSQRHPRTYHALVEHYPDDAALKRLRCGVVLDQRLTLPSHARILHPQPDYPARTPPVRFRKSVPDCWIELQLIEGRNRQVRRMTAAVGHPTLRLIRVAIGNLHLHDLAPGQWRELEEEERKLVFSN